MKRTLSFSFKLLGLLAALSYGNAFAVGGYTLGTPNTTLNSDGWALGSGNMSGFLGAISNTSNFGPGGIVNQSLTISQLSTVDATSLAGVNGLMVPWWNNSQSAASQTAINTAFRSGMDLWLLEDDTSHNLIGTGLGIAESPASLLLATGPAPLYIGPFGTGSSTVSGNFAQFTNIGTLGGTVGGTNTGGQVVVAYWAKGAFSPGSGALVIFGDVDMISNMTATYGVSPNGGGILGLNTMAWLMNGAQAIPEPNTYALMGLGGLVLLVRRFRSSR